MPPSTSAILRLSSLRLASCIPLIIFIHMLYSYGLHCCEEEDRSPWQWLNSYLIIRLDIINRQININKKINCSINGSVCITINLAVIGIEIYETDNKTDKDRQNNNIHKFNV